MKRYVLIQVEAPNGDTHSNTQSWIGFQSKTDRISMPAGHGDKLSENVWLIPEDDGLSLLARIVTVAEDHQLKYRAWFLTEEK